MSEIRYIVFVIIFFFLFLNAKGQEKVDISLERDIYIAGETIKYDAGYFLDEEMMTEPLSKVLYVELITNTGDKVSQAKICFSDSVIKGSLLIPEDTRSGNYYLRAYTKYMRNFSPQDYSYQVVCVVNPFSEEVFPDLKFQEHLVNSSKVYMPERNGLTISGRVIGSVDNNPIEGAELSISTVSDASYFSIGETDSSGRFLFELPCDLTVTEFSISIEGYEKRQVNILVDAEYCNKQINLNYIPFKIEDEAKVLKLVHQYQKYIQKGDEKSFKAEEDTYIPFYGEAGREISEKDYIELESIGEFVFELLYEFKYVESSNFLYPTGNASLKFSPVLVLIDNVRVYDVASFLKLPTRRVKRFEILRGGYIIGSKAFGGILNVVTEDDDMAGYIDQAARIYFEFDTVCQ
ncbi:MAG TPA: hypothetical protein VJ951_07680 [Bacteroidales bacterium]|nr:hypothetical protein [Bacteroidales bacterium]